MAKAKLGALSMIVQRSVARAAMRNARVAQFKHRLRWARQRVIRPDFAVVGGYHLGNVGDMALGYAIQHRVTESGISCGLQTIYNLERWPKVKAIIVGGGAVGYGDCLQKLRAAYGRMPNRVAILGVDFNDPAAVHANADFLNEVAVITCRSAAQAAEMQAVLGRQDVLWHPDLCFALHKLSAETKLPERSRVLGINCVPLFLRQSGDRLVPGASFLDEMQREEPTLIPHLDRLGGLYANLVQEICAGAKQAGVKVIHIPFTPMDDLFARTILKDREVEFVPYTANVASVLCQVGRCGRFFTSRFHSLVFAMLKNCEIVPFCYASKCDRLLRDLQIEGSAIIRVQDLVGGGSGLATRVINGPGINVANRVVEEACRRVTARVDAVITQLSDLAFG